VTLGELGQRAAEPVAGEHTGLCRDDGGRDAHASVGAAREPAYRTYTTHPSIDAQARV
jgi:hypothetical protein